MRVGDPLAGCLTPVVVATGVPPAAQMGAEDALVQLLAVEVVRRLVEVVKWVTLAHATTVHHYVALAKAAIRIRRRRACR